MAFVRLLLVAAAAVAGAWALASCGNLATLEELAGNHDDTADTGDTDG